LPYWIIDVLYGVSLFLCVSRRELDTHALAHEPEFAEILRERRDFGAIAAVQRRQRGERCERVGIRHDVAGRASEVYHGDRRALRVRTRYLAVV